MIFYAPLLILLFFRHFYTADGLRLVKHCGTYGRHAFDRMRNRMRLDFYSAAECVLLKLDIGWRRLGRFVAAQ
jgi:hypothetical protein